MMSRKSGNKWDSTFIQKLLNFTKDFIIIMVKLYSLSITKNGETK